MTDQLAEASRGEATEAEAGTLPELFAQVGRFSGAAKPVMRAMRTARSRERCRQDRYRQVRDNLRVKEVRAEGAGDARF